VEAVERPRRANGSETRDRLLRTAETLLAEQGIYAVPLREISRAAGQANRSVMQYYFGDRHGLVRAILDRHDPGIDSHRHRLLDEYEQGDLRALVTTWVLPLVAKLRDPDGGRPYLRIVAEFYSRPLPIEELFPKMRPDHSMERWHRELDGLVHAEERTVLHSRFSAIRFGHLELARRAAEPARRHDSLFASHLIDLVTAVLACPPSESTRDQLRRRRRRAR
jgi:AcrR family transcriptional regulator